MKKYFFLSLFATVLFALNVSAQASLVDSKWLFTETEGEAITFDLTFEAGGKASYKQTNGPVTGVFTWSGTPNNLIIEGAFGSSATIKMTGNIATGKLSYSSPWSVDGQSGTQTGEYEVESDTWDSGNLNGVDALVIRNLSATYAPATNQKWTTSSFAIRNRSTNPVVIPDPGYVSIDFYVTPSNETNQSLTNFVKVGDMPAKLPSLNGKTNQKFTVEGKDVYNMAREWLANQSMLKDGFYYLYVQVRKSDGKIVPRSGAFSSVGFIVGNAGVSSLKVANLSAVYAPATNQAFSPVSFSIKNLSPANYTTAGHGFVSIDFYASPSKGARQASSNFIKIGDMPCSLPAVNVGASQNFTVTGKSVYDMAREWLGNPSKLKKGQYYLYVQIRQEDGTITPFRGAFSETPFVVQ
jgi:hypothetical protein